MIKHFSRYEGSPPDINEYIHESKGVFWALCVSKAPYFKEKDIKLNATQQNEFDKGRYLKHFLIDFYNETDFEEYYTKILPKLNKIADEFKDVYEKSGIGKVISDVWQTSNHNKMIVIPNPFTEGSIGPKIGDINYQVIGTQDGKDIQKYRHNIIHEACHPHAKQIIEKHLTEIETIKNVLESSYKHPKYPTPYKHWKTCFEEHLIRAVHGGLIEPALNPKYSVTVALQYENNMKGMVFIDKFYNVLTKSKSVDAAIPAIIKNLA